MSRRVEVRTRTFWPKGEQSPLLLMEVHLLPRGGGNWKAARELADEFKNDPNLGPHVVRLVAGKSKVSVYFRPSLDLMRAVWHWPNPVPGTTDDPAQLKLFAGLLKGAS